MSDRRTGLRALAAGLGLWRRLVGAEPILVGGAAAIVTLTAVLLAGGARLVDRVAADDLREAVEVGPAEQHSLLYELSERIGPRGPDDPFGQIEETGARFVEEVLPPEVAAVLGPRQFVVETAPYRAASFPDQDDGPFNLSFRFRTQQGVEDQLTVVAGTLPVPRAPVPLLLGEDCPPDRTSVAGFEPDEEQDCRRVDAALFEVALTAQTAEDLLVGLGDRLVLRPDLDDQHWRFVFGPVLEERLVIEVSAIVELSDPSATYWYGDQSLHRARVRETADFRIVTASGLFAPEAYRGLIRSTGGAHLDYTWRHPVVAERLQPDRVDELLVDLDTLSIPEGRVVTRVPEVLAGHLDQRALTAALLSTVLAGTVAVAATAIWVLTALAAFRQSHSWRLAMARGVGRSRVAAIGAVHGLAVAVPPTVAGLMVGRLVVPGVATGRDVAVVGLLAIATVLATAGAVAAAVLSGTAPGGRLVGTASRGRLIGTAGGRSTPPARRLVRDGALVAAALGVVALTRRRAGAGVLDASGRLDLLLSVAPIVIGAGVAVIALRLAGPTYRVLAALAGRARGAVAFLGLRRLVAMDRTAGSTMVVVLLAVGLAGFAGSVRTSVEVGQERQAWQSVGADASIRTSGPAGTAVSPRLVEHLDELGRVSAVGTEFPAAAVTERATGPRTGTDRNDARRVDVVAIEAADLAGMVDLGAVGGDLPPALRALAPGDGGADLDGDGRDGLAAVATGRWPAGERPQIGDLADLQLDGLTTGIEIVAITERFPGLDPARPALVLDHVALSGSRPVGPRPTVVLLGDPVPDERLTAAVEDLAPGSVVRSRSSVLAAVADDPYTAWVGRGLTALQWFVSVVAAASVVAGLGLTAPARRRDLGLLTTLGLRRRQALIVGSLDQLAPNGLAVVAGVGLATALVWVLGPTLDIGAFAGGFARLGGGRPLVPAEVTIDPVAVVRSAGSILAVVVLASAWAAGRGRGAATRTILDEGEVR